MSKNLKKVYWPLVGLIILNLIIGWIILPEFGESADERSQIDYAKRTIHAAVSIVTQQVMPVSFVQEKLAQGSHGPAFIALVTLIRLTFLRGRSLVEQLRYYHLTYFLMFLIGVVSMYFLARRWVGQTAAFGTALLFNTQPILFGQAFMNPKDVIFMSLMTASAALGFWMVDHDEKSALLAGKIPWQGQMRVFLRGFLRTDVWLAGLLLGFTSAIRISGPLAGLVIFAYLLISRKWHILPRFLAYGLIAFTFMIVFWPYLWPDPIGRFIGSLNSSANYPGQHLTLFKGVLFDSRDIPITYLPVLLTLQLTETTLGLVALGLLSYIKKFRWDLFALIVIWFALPATAVILGKVHLYNNLRQVFFTFTPLFLLAGVGLEWLFTAIRRPIFRWGVILLAILPALVANVSLFPYQYIYYNQFTGGVHGAYRHFDLDYWDLGYKEAQQYINKSADHNASIYIDKSKNVAQTFARIDFSFNAYGKANFQKYNYIIVSTSRNYDNKYARFPTVYAVERDGVPLVLVKLP